MCCFFLNETLQTDNKKNNERDRKYEIKRKTKKSFR